MPTNAAETQFDLGVRLVDLAITETPIDPSDFSGIHDDLAQGITDALRAGRLYPYAALPVSANQGEIVMIDNGDGTVTRHIYRGVAWQRGETIVVATGATTGQHMAIPNASDTAPGLLSPESKRYLDKVIGTEVFASRADLEAAVIPESVTIVAHFNRNHVLYYHASDDHVALTTTGARTWAPLNAFTPQHFGADDTGATDCSPEILAWIDAFIAAGEVGRCDTGMFRLETGVVRENIAAHVHIKLLPGVRFVTGNIGSSAIQLKGSTTAQWRFTFDGGDVDTSNSAFVNAEGSGTGLSFTRFHQGSVKNYRCFTSQNEAENWPNWIQGGDSGIGCVDVRHMTFFNCVFEGQPDLGIYPGGNSSIVSDSDDGAFVTFLSCHFHNCWSGIGIKREMEKCIIANCTFSNSRGGASVSGVSTVFPARDIVIVNNQFSQIGWRPIRVQSRGGTAKIEGNMITDWGYDRDGVTPVGPRSAVILEGVQHATIHNNTFQMQRWANTPNHRCIDLTTYTFDAGGPNEEIHHSGHIDVANNMVINVDTFVRESDGNQGPVTGAGNRLSGVSTPLQRQHADSWIGFTDDVDANLVKLEGGPSVGYQVNGRRLGGRLPWVPVPSFGTAPAGGLNVTVQEGSAVQTDMGLMVMFDLQFSCIFANAGEEPQGYFRITGLPIVVDQEPNGGGVILFMNNPLVPNPEALRVNAAVSAGSGQTYLDLHLLEPTGTRTITASDVASLGSGVSLRMRAMMIASSPAAV